MDSLVSALATHGFGVSDGFLSGEELADINRGFAQWLAAGNFRPAGIGGVASRQHNPHIRGDETWWFDLAAPPRELSGVLARIAELQQTLNRQLFLGLKDWEVHLAQYAPGAAYRKHLDRPAGTSARKLSLILYLNQAWDAADGGELVVYAKDHTELQRILPVGGRLVAFLSEDFPHEVLAARRPRRSLTGWFLDVPRGVV